jgi:cell division protein FtsI (penicillin-binding protein 3)
MLVWLVLMLGMLGLIINLFRLQFFEASMLQGRARAQQVIAWGVNAPRRAIVDRNKGVLALDQPVFTLYAHPSMFRKSKETIAAALVPILNQSASELVKAMNQGPTGIRLAEGLPEPIAHRVKALRLDGLELDEQQQRLYPQQDLMSNIVGYVNVDRQGQAGVELTQERILQRSKENALLSRSGDGSIIPVGLPGDFLKKDQLRLQLTLDSRLQRAVQIALKQKMEAYQAKRGGVIVMDVNDGSIRAMVSEPTFDPNKYYATEVDRLRNWTLSDLYEPGSTFKPVNIAIALEAGVIKPTDTVYDEGAIEIDGWPIQNNDFEAEGGRGNLSIGDVLKYSSNVGMVHIMQRLQAGVYYGWLERLGLDRPTGIDLPAEAAGQSKGYQQFTSAKIESATTAFGQGFSLTPLKLIQLHSTIANGGKLIIPHVVRGLVDPDGNLEWRPNLPTPRQIFSPQNTQEVLRMMEEVVANGTGKAAQINGYQVAGKTGTAQKAAPGGGYIEGARITSFIGILPVENPRYAVLAVVDEPQGENAYGSTVAAPLVREVMSSLITLEKIPPSQPEALQNPAPEESEDEPLPEIPIEYPIE